MARYPLSLPIQLKQAAEVSASSQGVSLNQFILWAVAEKVGELRQTVEGKEARPNRADRVPTSTKHPPTAPVQPPIAPVQPPTTPVRQSRLVFQFSRRKLAEICHRNGVAWLAVLGSVTLGGAEAGNDLDLLVRFSSRKSLLNMVRLEREFTSALGRKVDLQSESSLSAEMRENILPQLVVLYEV